MEEVLLKSERTENRSDVAEYLRTVADRLESGGDFTLSSGGESVDLDVPDRPTFEVKVEREVEGSETELSVEFELEWYEGESGDGGGGGGLEIE